MLQCICALTRMSDSFQKKLSEHKLVLMSPKVTFGLDGITLCHGNRWHTHTPHGPYVILMSLWSLCNQQHYIISTWIPHQMMCLFVQKSKVKGVCSGLVITFRVTLGNTYIIRKVNLQCICGACLFLYCFHCFTNQQTIHTFTQTCVNISLPLQYHSSNYASTISTTRANALILHKVNLSCNMLTFLHCFIALQTKNCT
jgi:hypothetical protein